jgi:hypothetical protein
MPSRTRPDEPTQIAPEFSTTGSRAAANPPVIGSLALPRATRLETTTRFTFPSWSALFNCRSSIWFLTPHFVPGSDPSKSVAFREIFGELKPNSDFAGWNPGSPMKRKRLMLEEHGWR